MTGWRKSGTVQKAKTLYQDLAVRYRAFHQVNTMQSFFCLNLFPVDGKKSVRVFLNFLLVSTVKEQ